VAILTSFSEPVEVFAALEAGVDGYLIKDSDAEGLVAALVAVAAGQQVLHRKIRPLVFGGISPNSTTGRLSSLTASERRILSLVTEGRTNKEIADVVSLAEKTVRNHMSVILSKLGVERRAQAVALFVEEQAKLRP
jgi:two-component system response regulator DevR